MRTHATVLSSVVAATILHVAATVAEGCGTTDCDAPGGCAAQACDHGSAPLESHNVQPPADDRLRSSFIQVPIFAFQFLPQELFVPTQTTVRWRNFDSPEHTATSIALPAVFDSGLLGENETYDALFTSVGTFDYQCDVHPDMTGAIRVRRPGDTDGNNAIDLDDFTVLAANFGLSDRIYPQGDFNLDRNVNLDDFTILAADFGTPAPRFSSAVPEPAAIFAILFAPLVFARRRDSNFSRLKS